MSRSPEPERDNSSLSPPKFEDGNGNGNAPIAITVHSVMAGLKDVTITVPADATVGKLKRIISIISDVPVEQQILIFKDKVLSNEDATLASYGMVTACTITMNLKMNTGSRKYRKTARAAEMMLFLPLLLVPKDDVNDLRDTIREMTAVKSFEEGVVAATLDRMNILKLHNLQKSNNSESKHKVMTRAYKIVQKLYCEKPTPPDEEAAKWTPAKQMENEITRNRMKKLLRKRKRLSILSPTPSRGSVLSLSPVESRTPDEASNDKIVAVLPEATDSMQEVSEKDLQCFFEPPECQEELELQQSELFVPPESVEELNQVKMKRDIELRTICKMCHRKLSLTEQEIKCLCQQVFCKRHRAPAAHLCPIDYKQTGRSRISKENLKASCRRTHRAPKSD